MDRPVPALLTQQRHHPLRLAERVGADDVGALGKQRHRIDQLAHLAPRIGMAEDRQAEGGLSDEHVAGHHFERQAGRIGRALVVAGDDDALSRPLAFALDRDLRRSEHVAGGGEEHGDVADPHPFSQPRLLAGRAKSSP